MHGIHQMRLPPGRDVWHSPTLKILGVLTGVGFTAWFGRAVWPEPEVLEGDAFSPASSTFQVPLEVSPKGLDLYHATDLLIETLVQIESAGDAKRVGSWGERGLMQIRPVTWRETTERYYGKALPFDQAFDPALNRKVGRLYLGDLQEYLYKNRLHWKSDLRSLLFASYNAGPQRVRAAGFDVKRLPRGVRDYVQRASALHDWHLAHDAVRLQEILLQAQP